MSAILNPKTRPAPKVPDNHNQWAKLDLAEILALPTAYLAIGYANSILSPKGAQAAERLWERGRLPGGAIGNTVKLVHAARQNGIRMIWTKYRIFRQEYPQSPMDKVQYDFWASHYPGWTEEQKQWDWQPVDEIKALMRPNDPEIYYTSLGNVFLGTMLPAYSQHVGHPYSHPLRIPPRLVHRAGGAHLSRYGLHADRDRRCVRLRRRDGRGAHTRAARSLLRAGDLYRPRHLAHSEGGRHPREQGRPLSRAAQPLKGLRVLELGELLAGPLVGTLLGEFGAEVIKVERPGRGDVLRQFGPAYEGESLYWTVNARNKKSVVLDLGSDVAKPVLEDLIARADVLVNSLRPGTLEGWGFDEETLRSRYPRLVIVYASAFGRTGPKSNLGGYDPIAQGYSGLSFLTGEAAGPPMRAGGAIPVCDFMTGFAGALGAVMALYRRDASAAGHGATVDIALYDVAFRMLGPLLALQDLTGDTWKRDGNHSLGGAPTGHFQTSGGEWICTSVQNDAQFKRLAALIGRPEWLADKRFESLASRTRHRDAIEAVVVRVDPRAQSRRGACSVRRCGPPRRTYQLDGRLGARRSHRPQHLLGRGREAALPPAHPRARVCR